MLFLTVSFHSSPYYTGSDIVFVFAWLPMIIGGAGGVLALDHLPPAAGIDQAKEGSATLVPVVPFNGM